MTADDVVASINHHRGEDSKSAAKAIGGPTPAIKATASDTVVFELNGPATPTSRSCLSDYHLGIMPGRPDGKIDWQSGIGTGGYMLESFEPGVRTSFKRNPNYWKEGRAYFDAVEMPLHRRCRGAAERVRDRRDRRHRPRRPEDRCIC